MLGAAALHCRGVVDIDLDADDDLALAVLLDVVATPSPKQTRAWKRMDFLECLDGLDIDASSWKVLCLRLDRKRRDAERVTADTNCLQRVWDQERLFAKDTVSEGANAGRHSNAWNEEAVVSSAFAALGSGPTADSKSEFHNGCIMTKCTAWVADEKQSSMVEDMFCFIH